MVEARTAPVTEAAKISAAAVSTAVECWRLETASMHIQSTRASEGDRVAKLSAVCDCLSMNVVSSTLRTGRPLPGRSESTVQKSE